VHPSRSKRCTGTFCFFPAPGNTPINLFKANKCQFGDDPQDLTDEEGIDLDVDDLDWNDLNY
jgi:hypothetical protein